LFPQAESPSAESPSAESLGGATCLVLIQYKPLAEALGVDSLELLELADKVRSEVEKVARRPETRKFLHRAKEIASPNDWGALLDLLEKRQRERSEKS
jgi:hypothetical protein